MDISGKLERLKDVTTQDLLDVLCVRLAFSTGPDASSFVRRSVEDLDEMRARMGATEDEWTNDALTRVCGKRAG